MLTKKRVVGATALVVVAAAIGTVPAIAGQDPKPERTAVGPAVSWTSSDGAAYISDYSHKPKSKKWRREHRRSTANWPGRWQDDVNPDKKHPSVPPAVGTETVTAAPSITGGPTGSVTTDSNYPTATVTGEQGYTSGATVTPVPGLTGSPSGDATGSPTLPGTGLPTVTGSVNSSGETSAPGTCSTPTSTSTDEPTGTTGTGTPTPTATATGETTTTSTTTSTSATPAEPGAETTPSCDIPNRSGVPWGASGVFMPGDNPSDVDAFGQWRGAPVDVAVTWPARQTWDDVINPAWVFSAWKDTPYTMALGVAPVPEADDSATMAGCAAGQYNDKWVQFGQNFKDAGMDDSIIRLGWEFNGNWYKWSASNPGQFAECFRQIVKSARTTAPDLKWDWTVNRGVSAGLADATQAYPGDEYVDYVGIDSYDMWPGANNDQTWDQHLNGEFGLKFWAGFAKEHGKKLTVPEWGVYPGTGSAGANGGDNALYVNKMFEFFKSMGSDLAYEAYFNEDASYYAGPSSRPNQNPNAAGIYQTMIASDAEPAGDQ